MNRQMSTASRLLLSALFCYAGVAHLVDPELFMRAMPPYLPEPRLLIAISGFFEIMGGLGVLTVLTRQAAGVGLIALLIVVFPANVQMALHPEKFAEIPPLVLWLRLPLQLLLIYWVKRAAL